jgi:hypothetical protein
MYEHNVKPLNTNGIAKIERTIIQSMSIE